MSDRNYSIEELRDSYGIGADDLTRIRTIGKYFKPKIGEFIDAFYVWLRTQPEYLQHFSNPVHRDNPIAVIEIREHCVLLISRRTVDWGSPVTAQGLPRGTTTAMDSVTCT